MRNEISQLMKKNGVTCVARVTKTSSYKENNRLEAVKPVSLSQNQDVTRVTNPRLSQLLHPSHIAVAEVCHKKPNNINAITPATPATPVTPQKQCDRRKHSNIILPPQFTFNWHLRQLRQTHGDRLPSETLEAIAFHRTSSEWISYNLLPMARYDEAQEHVRYEQARAALIDAGLKPCKRLIE